MEKENIKYIDGSPLSNLPSFDAFFCAIGKHQPRSPWERLRQLLLVAPTSPNTSRSIEVAYKEALLRGFHHYEQENVPVKILHAATYWKAISKEDGWT